MLHSQAWDRLGKFIKELQGPESQIAFVTFYVIDIATNLWGCDLLQQFGAFLTIPSMSNQVKTMMLNMGYNPLRPLQFNA